MQKPIAANDNSSLFYVYVWRRPDGVPFYVGKGRGRMAYNIYDRSPEFSEIHSRGGCTVEIVDEFVHESQALAYEVELIARYGRSAIGGTLVNKTDGGDGCAGHIKTADTIEKWRAKNVGRKRSKEAGTRISAAKMGHPVSEETRAKISSAARKRFEDPEERERMRIIASNVNADARAKMSIAQKKRFEDQDARHLLATYWRGRSHTDVAKAKISATLRGVPKAASTIASMRVAQRMKPPRGAYKGVSADGGKWRALIFLDGSNRYLGRFDTQEEAARAYDGAAIAAWGIGGCYLNFPHASNDNEQHQALAA